jgi:hypothetical protein
MRLVFLGLALAAPLAACNNPPPRTGPSTTTGLPVVTQPYPAGGGAGGVAPLERPAGSRGGDKGS